jgi:hypothetical protein
MASLSIRFGFRLELALVGLCDCDRLFRSCGIIVNLIMRTSFIRNRASACLEEEVESSSLSLLPVSTPNMFHSTMTNKTRHLVENERESEKSFNILALLYLSLSLSLFLSSKTSPAGPYLAHHKAPSAQSSYRMNRAYRKTQPKACRSPLKDRVCKSKQDQLSASFLFFVSSSDLL